MSRATPGRRSTPGALIVSDAGLGRRPRAASSTALAAVHRVHGHGGLGRRARQLEHERTDGALRDLYADDRARRRCRGGPGGLGPSTPLSIPGRDQLEHRHRRQTSSPTHAWFTSDDGDGQGRPARGAVRSPSEAVRRCSPSGTTSPPRATTTAASSRSRPTVRRGSMSKPPAAFSSPAATTARSARTARSPLAAATGIWAGSGPLQQVQVDLTSLAGGDLWIRFRFGCDSSVSSTGWWVDDVRIETTAPCEMLFGDGFESGDCGNWIDGLGRTIESVNRVAGTGNRPGGVCRCRLIYCEFSATGVFGRLRRQPRNKGGRSSASSRSETIQMHPRCASMNESGSRRYASSAPMENRLVLSPSTRP